MQIFHQPMTQAFLLILICSGIPLGISAVTGLAVSLLQAATQIQEQTTSFLIKFLVTALVIFFGSGWLGNLLQNYLQAMLTYVGYLGDLT